MANFRPDQKSTATLMRTLALCVVLLLASCGGGTMDTESVPDPSPVAAKDGSVYPAAAGVVMVEYDADGVELQRSSASDAAGTFRFDRALSGRRIQALAAEPDLTLPVLRSATLGHSNAAIEVTPLTTLFDQLVGAGYTQGDATRAVSDLLAIPCGQDAAEVAATAVLADTPLTGRSREWLVRALGAYVDAFRRIGLSPLTPGLRWLSKLDERSQLLGEMCTTAQTIFSDAWLTATMHSITSDSKVLETPHPARISTLQQHAADEVLALAGRRLAALEYFEFVPIVAEDDEAIAGAGADLAARLTVAEFAAGAGLTTETANLSLDRSGQIIKTLAAVASATQGGAPTLRFANQGSADVRVRLTIDGAELTDLRGVLDQILTLPAIGADEPIWQRAWRFVARRTRYAYTITGGLFWQQPDLFIRSIGAAQCDVLSSALHWIWLAMGHDARVYMLSGHLVPKILVADRWEMYDPTYGIYYLDRAGNVASVNELTVDPTLITNPISPAHPLGYVAYSQSIADLYSSQHDNWVEPWYSTPNPQPLGDRFTIPHGGYLEVIAATPLTMDTREPGERVNVVPVRLWFPPGYSGTADLPLILVDVAGDGTVSLPFGVVEVGPQGMQATISDYYTYMGGPSTGISTLTIQRVGPNGLTVTLATNTSYYGESKKIAAALSGPEISGLALTAGIAGH